MRRPATLMIDGKPYLWRDLLTMRREQLEQRRRPDQPTLFALRDDRRPAPERTAAGRYAQPSLFTLLGDAATANRARAFPPEADR